jgi:branched-chain amino acid transport system ATP-binding protein
MSTKKTLIETRNLTKQFGGLLAVDHVNYQLREGEIAGIIGPNGAGKTSFFNLLTGLFYPTEGQIYFQGKDITKIPSHERVTMGLVRTFQLVSVFNSLTVLDNLILAHIRFGRHYTSKWEFFLSNAHSPDVLEACRETLNEVGLIEKENRMVSNLSYGDKRKLEIAIALSLRPKFLLFDEPFAGLSEGEIDELSKLINKIKNELSLIIIEHKISKIVNLVEKLSVMHKGQIIIEGNPNDVLNDCKVRQVYWHEGV